VVAVLVEESKGVMAPAVIDVVARGRMPCGLLF
jgi:hypothetical protein